MGTGDLEADHSLLSIAEELYLHFTIRPHGVMLRQRDNFTFYSI